MTVPVITNLGEIGFSKGAGVTRVITIDTALVAGDLVVVLNAGLDGIQLVPYTNLASVSDSGSNVWDVAGPGGFAVITTPLSIGATITATFATPPSPRIMECGVVNAHAFRGFNYPTTATLTAYRDYLGLGGSGAATREPLSVQNSSTTDTGIAQDPGAASSSMPPLTSARFLQTHDFLTGAALGAPAGGVHMALLSGPYGSDNPNPFDTTDLTTRIALAGYSSLEFTYGTIRRQLAAVLNLGIYGLPVWRVDRPGFNTFIDLSVADGSTFNYSGVLSTLQFWYYPDAAADARIGRLPLLGAG